MLLNMLHKENRIPYIQGEKIRIVILFYIPSAWASLESVYNLLSRDPRFELTMLVYEGTLDKNVSEKSGQIRGGIEFLQPLNIPYAIADDYNFAIKKPHIVLYQSPWENAHLPSYLRTNYTGLLGSRVAYIPYGIEYAKTNNMTQRFSNMAFSILPWRMYSISELMLKEHKTGSPGGFDFIRVTGHPKFDFLVNSQLFVLNSDLIKNIGCRKIVLMTFHFPFMADATTTSVPPVAEYINFLKQTSKYTDLYFLLRPHPKFFYEYELRGETEAIREFKEIIKTANNMSLDSELDYRYALCNAAYIIGDRSALMVEAAAMNVPVLYMTNFFYQEPMLAAMEPLFNSYYQGNSAYDIEEFIRWVVIGGDDYKKEIRESARKVCIPYIDGKCGERIVEDMAASIYEEARMEKIKWQPEKTSV